MARTLKDDQSARWGEWTYRRVNCVEGPHEIVCGTVNAKNSFGAYSGAEGFVYIGTGAEYFMAAERSNDIRSLSAYIDAAKLCATAAP